MDARAEMETVVLWRFQPLLAMQFEEGYCPDKLGVEPLAQRGVLRQWIIKSVEPQNLRVAIAAPGTAEPLDERRHAPSGPDLADGPHRAEIDSHFQGTRADRGHRMAGL